MFSTMPPPIPIFSGQNLIIRRTGRHLRVDPVNGANIFSRLPVGDLRYLQLRLDDVYSVRSDGLLLVLQGAFEVPLRSLNVELGPLAPDEPAAVAERLSRILRLPREVESLTPQGFANALHIPGVRWVSIRGVRRRTFLRMPDFEGVMLYSSVAPYDVPIHVAGKLVVPQGDLPPPLDAYGGPYLTALSVATE